MDPVFVSYLRRQAVTGSPSVTPHSDRCANPDTTRFVRSNPSSGLQKHQIHRRLAPAWCTNTRFSAPIRKRSWSILFMCIWLSFTRQAGSTVTRNVQAPNSRIDFSGKRGTWYTLCTFEYRSLFYSVFRYRWFFLEGSNSRIGDGGGVPQGPRGGRISGEG